MNRTRQRRNVEDLCRRLRAPLTLMLAVVGLVAADAPWMGGPVLAAGLLKPSEGGEPLTIEEHRVHVDINNGIAATEVVQVFRNDSPNPLEAIYSFPLPPQASLAGFSMWINGDEITGEVLERQQARDIYESIAHPAVPDQQTADWQTAPRPLKDPGLVEEVSYREFQVTVFPVPANGTQRLRLLYYEYLTAEDGRITYVYPMETRVTEDSRAGGRFSLDVEVRSVVPVGEYEFPEDASDRITGEALGPNRLRASLVRTDGDLDRDFVMRYSIGRDDPGLDLISFRTSEEAGYFMALATAPPGAPIATPVDYTFVVDVSGSMRRQRRLAVAGEALASFLESCPAEDRFNVIAFNVTPLAMSADSLPNNSASRAALSEFLARFRGVGGTDLFPALELAYGQSSRGRRHAIVVVSDGGLNDLHEDHARFLGLARGHSATLFGVALGNEANVPLLEALAAETGGFTTRISHRDDFARRGATLRERMRQEPLRHLQLEIDGDDQLLDVVPARIPDLYPGRQVAVLGRYRGAGGGSVRIHATRDGLPIVLASAGTLPRENRLNPEVRRLWAERKTFDLLQQRRAGRISDDARRAVVRLGVEHAIVTPYTSFIVLESDEMFSDFGIERRNRALLEEERQAREQRAQLIESKTVPAEESTPRPGPMDNLGGSIDPFLLGTILLLAAGTAVVSRFS